MLSGNKSLYGLLVEFKINKYLSRTDKNQRHLKNKITGRIASLITAVRIISSSNIYYDKLFIVNDIFNSYIDITVNNYYQKIWNISCYNQFNTEIKISQINQIKSTYFKIKIMSKAERN